MARPGRIAENRFREEREARRPFRPQGSKGRAGIGGAELCAPPGHTPLTVEAGVGGRREFIPLFQGLPRAMSCGAQKVARAAAVGRPPATWQWGAMDYPGVGV